MDTPARTSAYGAVSGTYNHLGNASTGSLTKHDKQSWCPQPQSLVQAHYSAEAEALGSNLRHAQSSPHMCV